MPSLRWERAAWDRRSCATCSIGDREAEHGLQRAALQPAWGERPLWDAPARPSATHKCVAASTEHLPLGSAARAAPASAGGGGNSRAAVEGFPGAQLEAMGSDDQTHALSAAGETHLRRLGCHPAALFLHLSPGLPGPEPGPWDAFRGRPQPTCRAHARHAALPSRWGPDVPRPSPAGVLGHQAGLAMLTGSLIEGAAQPCAKCTARCSRPRAAPCTARSTQAGAALPCWAAPAHLLLTAVHCAASPLPRTSRGVMWQRAEPAWCCCRVSTAALATRGKSPPLHSPSCAVHCLQCVSLARSEGVNSSHV